MDYSKICFGIPSYLPDGKARSKRLKKVKATLNYLSKTFPNVSVLIIAQNWNDALEVKNNWIVYNYDRLGITGARIKLREKFLESKFEHLIMLDDEIVFNVKKPELFLSEILKHPDGWTIFGRNIQFAIISKYLYSKIRFPDVDVIRDHIYEDIVFVKILQYYFNDSRYTISQDIVEYSPDKNATTADDSSTWYEGDMLIMKKCLMNTGQYVADHIHKSCEWVDQEIVDKKKNHSNTLYTSGGGFGLFGL